MSESIEPVQLTDLSWYDGNEATVVISIDRLTVAFELEEFLDFFKTVEETKDELSKRPEIGVGTYVEDGMVKEQFMILPEIEEIN